MIRYAALISKLSNRTGVTWSRDADSVVAQKNGYTITITDGKFYIDGNGVAHESLIDDALSAARAVFFMQDTIPRFKRLKGAASINLDE